MSTASGIVQTKFIPHIPISITVAAHDIAECPEGKENDFGG